MQTLKEFLDNMVEKNEGFEIGSPWRFDSSILGVAVPIIRNKEVRRSYVMLEEVKDKVEISDSGGIRALNAKNHSGKDVFVRVGSLFSGSTQSRGAITSTVLEKPEQTVPVRCVHASNPIRTGSGMNRSGTAPDEVIVNLMKGDQHDVWNSVRSFSHAHGISNGAHHSRSRTTSTRHLYRMRGFNGEDPIAYSCRSFTGSGGGHRGVSFASTHVGDIIGDDDLVSAVKKVREFSDDVNEMLKRVPLFDNQVGAFIFDQSGVIGFETFDSSKSWKAIHNEIVHKYGEKLMKKQAEPIFELREDVIPEKIKEYLEKMKMFVEQTTIKGDHFETISLRGDGVIGEYTLHRGKVVHIITMRENN